MTLRIAVLAFLAGLLSWPAAGWAQKDLCGAIREQLLVANPVQETQQIQQQQKRALSGDYLFGTSGTIPCLVELLREPASALASPEIDGERADRLLRITGALRSILTTRGTGAIREFRAVDDPVTTTVLAYAARSADAGLRVNATLVLADVIDDSTVCVPIDHLYDPKLLAGDGGASGRINLIGVVAVVAPWAYKPTFHNIARLLDKLSADVAGQTDVAQARAVIANLKARLDFQRTSSKAPNMLSDLPPNERDCLAYKPVWAGAALRY